MPPTGYGRPPKSYRFRKGQSGNPRGRPKSGRNFSTEFMEAVSEPVSALPNPESAPPVTKLQATIRQLVDKAASGDARATAKVIELIAELEARAEGALPSFRFTEADREAILEVHRRLVRGK